MSMVAGGIRVAERLRIGEWWLEAWAEYFAANGFVKLAVEHRQRAREIRAGERYPHRRELEKKQKSVRPAHRAKRGS